MNKVESLETTPTMELLDALERTDIKVMSDPSQFEAYPRGIYDEVARRLQIGLMGAEMVDLLDWQAPEQTKVQSASIAIMVDRNTIARTDSAMSWLLNRRYGEVMDRPTNDPWWSHPVPCFPHFEDRRHPTLRTSDTATAFLVRPDVVATAAHNMTGTPENVRFVFDYSMITPERGHCLFRDVEVRAACASKLVSGNSDWILLRLDRPITDRPPLSLADSSKVAVDTAVYAIGHPLGLPAKVSIRSRVTRKGRLSFRANLRIYGGNSGGPVFDARSNQVIGLVGQIMHGNDTRALQRVSGRLELLPTEPETEGSVTCAMLDELIQELNRA